MPNRGVFAHPSLLLETPIHFSPGDILHITPEGECLRIYEKNSNDNSLLVTGACNNRCLMCPQPPVNHCSGYKAELSSLLDLMDPSPEALGVTGGEPTCAFEDLLFLLDKIAGVHQHCHIQLLTNGRLLADYEKAKLLHASNRNITYCIPLYSDVSDIHDRLVGVPGAFDETLEGIGSLLRLGAAIEIRMVMTALNYKRLPQWAEFLYRNMPAIIHAAIMDMEPIGLAKTNFDMLWIDAGAYASELAAAVRTFKRQGIPVSLYNYPLCKLPQVLRSYAVKSISGWKVRFVPECEQCILKNACGGFFFSALAFPDMTVQPITNPHGVEHASSIQK
jgi:His-Xaa-Ser system radical SAM maturase HxsC